MVLVAPSVTKYARYLTAWWSITESGVPSGACKQMRAWKSAMIPDTSSVGKPCNQSKGGTSDFFLGRKFCVFVLVVVCARGCYSRGGTFCQGCCRKCFHGRGGTCCQGGCLRLVRGTGTVAVRATRLLLDRRGRCRRVLHGFKNSVEVLLRLWCSIHLYHLLVGRPNHGLPAARQHQLQDPPWRRGAVEHALPQVGRRLDADRFMGKESAWRGEDVLRQARALSNASRR